MRKFALLLLVLSIMMLLIACGGKDEPDTTPSTPDNPTTNQPQQETPTDPDPSTQGNPSTTPTYTITWMDENGNVLSTASVNENTVPAYTYSVTDTAEWDYTFEGWSAEAGGTVLTSIPTATGNATYYAKVSKVKQTYTVTFNSNGGSTVQSQTVEYGAKATVPAKPTYENHKFVSWCYNADGTSPVDFDTPITGNVTFYAAWNETADVKAILAALLSSYQMHPSAYIPESMYYDYSDNLVETDDIITDYSSSVNVSNITYGFGEQWHMILENLRQTNTFFNVLSIVEGLSSESIAVFNDYFDKNPSDTAHHEFKTGIYNVTIRFDGETMFYVLDYTTNVPVFGEQTVQIALSMDVESGEKNVRMQIGDANALSYRITENTYEFAIKYLGVRRAMFSIERNDDGSITGSIYEFIVVSAVEIASAAEFHITEDYVSVVGNKADGMVGFSGYIAELYNAGTGKMVGYEVKETLSLLNFDTLWFNLGDVMGINSIKYRTATDDVDDAFFINGSSTAWAAKKNLNTSRRFDIEFRTQYVYSYDPSTGEYTEHAIQVPMFFVQEGNYDTVVADVKSTNKVDIVVTVDSTDLDKLLEDYDTLVPIFIENKDDITPDDIVAYIGNKYTFETEN